MFILSFPGEKPVSTENKSSKSETEVKSPKSETSSGDSQSGQTRAAPFQLPEAGFAAPNPFDFSAMTGLLNVCRTFIAFLSFKNI